MKPCRAREQFGERCDRDPAISWRQLFENADAADPAETAADRLPLRNGFDVIVTILWDGHGKPPIRIPSAGTHHFLVLEKGTLRHTRKSAAVSAQSAASALPNSSNRPATSHSSWRRIWELACDSTTPSRLTRPDLGSSRSGINRKISQNHPLDLQKTH